MGIPLNDADRRPWLKALHTLLKQKDHEGTKIILACSALKKDYRDLLRDGLETLIFIFLRGDFDLIWKKQ